ncbi:MAG: hypothetical protein GXO55_11475 [Chloroflexi bacterium]|nr:hypothetical protein [Chloroflexota bacterium]
MGNLSFWRDVAVVVLAVEMFLIGLASLVLLFLMVRGLGWGRIQVYVYARRLRDMWRQLHKRVDRTTAKVRAPFEQINKLGRIMSRQ